MRRAERVVDIDVRHLRQLLGKRRIVRFLFGVIADIFQQQKVAGSQGVRRFFDLFTDAIVHERDRPLDQVGQPGGHWPQRHRRFALAVRPAEMTGENDARALFNQQFEGWQRLLDARVIVDDHPAILLLHRHVVIHAHQDAFAAHVQIFDGQLRHKKSNRRGRITKPQGESNPDCSHPLSPTACLRPVQRTASCANSLCVSAPLRLCVEAGTMKTQRRKGAMHLSETRSPSNHRSARGDVEVRIAPMPWRRSE